MVHGVEAPEERHAMHRVVHGVRAELGDEEREREGDRAGERRDERVEPQRCMHRHP